MANHSLGTDIMEVGIILHSRGDRMIFGGVQNVDFVQIQSNLSKSNHFFLNFVSIFPKFRHNFFQI